MRVMHGTGEAGILGLAANPNLPEDLMRAIDKTGDSLAHSTLARNARLPRDLLDKYLADEDQPTRNAARVNVQIDPRYARPEDAMLGGQ
jgi:hypothetical protein